MGGYRLRPNPSRGATVTTLRISSLPLTHIGRASSPERCLLTPSLVAADLEPKLTRHGYDVYNLAEQFNAKPAEIRRFLRSELDAARTRELTDEMRDAGLPIWPHSGF